MFYSYRLAYSVWMIDSLIDRHSLESGKHLEIFVMYDIACILQKHLKVRSIIIIL